MVFTIIWSPSARLDLKDISAYIAEDNPAVAERFITSLFEVVERLIAFPESGRIVPEFGDSTIREIIFKPCRIIYRIENSKQIIEIVRVWHGARGIPGV